MMATVGIQEPGGFDDGYGWDSRVRRLQALKLTSSDRKTVDRYRTRAHGMEKNDHTNA